MKRQLLLGIVLIALYLGTHVYNLTILPIFADEAIYIRWSQLIIDDWQQYLFFPLNDGKTPLLMWLQVPLLQIFTDPLFAVRLLSVGVGLVQTGVMYVLTRRVGGGRVAAWLSACMVTILPYWYFHHRMALIDGMLTLWMSVTVFFLWTAHDRLRELGSVKLSGRYIRKIMTDWRLVAFGGAASLSFAIALWTKLPAVLLIPSVLVFSLAAGKTRLEAVSHLILGGGVLAVGYALFLTQALHPAFPQLYSRGSDFLYPVSQLLAGEVLGHTLPSALNYARYFVAYATLPFWLLLLSGLFYGRHSRLVHILFWSGVAYILPIALLGKVVYPRYLLPAMLFFTPAVGLTIESYVLNVRSKLQPTKLLLVVAIALLCANIVNFSGRFIIPALVQPNAIPFVSADREQYLTEWSSGHGVVEVAGMIQQAARTRRIAVATEGYFGTLPDALLAYFHNKPVEMISIEGIGQPVQKIPDEFLVKHAAADERWLVVNSHRLAMQNPGTLLAQFCRPFGAPCLQVWRLDE